MNETWNFLDPNLSSTDLTERYEQYVTEILEVNCPKQTIFVHPDDSLYITVELKALKRRIMREYEKKGKSEKYFNLKELFQRKILDAANKYKQKIIASVVDGDRASTYKSLRKLGVRPGDSSSSNFQLPGHSSLTPQESVEILADHFAAISNEFEPVTVENLSLRVRQALSHVDSSSIPDLYDYDVYRKLRRAKKPLSVVPGDLPQKVMKEF